MQLAGLKDGYSKQGLEKLPQNAFLYVVDSGLKVKACVVLIDA